MKKKNSNNGSNSPEQRTRSNNKTTTRCRRRTFIIRLMDGWDRRRRRAVQQSQHPHQEQQHSNNSLLGQSRSPPNISYKNSTNYTDRFISRHRQVFGQVSAARLPRSIARRAAAAAHMKTTRTRRRRRGAREILNYYVWYIQRAKSLSYREEKNNPPNEFRTLRSRHVRRRRPYEIID